MPTCLRCRRDTETPAPTAERLRVAGDDVLLELDPAALAQAARELAPGASRVERAGLEALGYCPVCGQAL